MCACFISRYFAICVPWHCDQYSAVSSINTFLVEPIIDVVKSYNL